MINKRESAPIADAREVLPEASKDVAAVGGASTFHLDFDLNVTPPLDFDLNVAPPRRSISPA